MMKMMKMAVVISPMNTMSMKNIERTSSVQHPSCLGAGDPAVVRMTATRVHWPRRIVAPVSATDIARRIGGDVDRRGVVVFRRPLGPQAALNATSVCRRTVFRQESAVEEMVAVQHLPRHSTAIAGQFRHQRLLGTRQTANAGARQRRVHIAPSVNDDALVTCCSVMMLTSCFDLSRRQWNRFEPPRRPVLIGLTRFTAHNHVTCANNHSVGAVLSVRRNNDGRRGGDVTTDVTDCRGQLDNGEERM